MLPHLAHAPAPAPNLEAEALTKQDHVAILTPIPLTVLLCKVRRRLRQEGSETTTRLSFICATQYLHHVFALRLLLVVTSALPL